MLDQETFAAYLARAVDLFRDPGAKEDQKQAFRAIIGMLYDAGATIKVDGGRIVVDGTPLESAAVTSLIQRLELHGLGEITIPQDPSPSHLFELIKALAEPPGAEDIAARLRAAGAGGIDGIRVSLTAPPPPAAEPAAPDLGTGGILRGLAMEDVASPATPVAGVPAVSHETPPPPPAMAPPAASEAVAPRASVPELPQLPSRAPVLCAGCPHRTSFYVTRKVFGKKTVYCNDIGCYTLGYGEPLDSADVLLCMGSSISQASGIARTTGSRTVAYIGDSTFFHSGLPALFNAVQAGDPITVVILNNYVTAMTGFQPSPTGTKRPLIEDTVRGLGVQEIYSVDPFDEEASLDALRKARASDGINVVVFNSPCVVNEARLGIGAARAPYVIDEALCNACSLCVRKLGCPAIFVEDGRYFIDPDLCDGCDLCARLCSQDAIRPMPEHERRT